MATLTNNTLEVSSLSAQAPKLEFSGGPGFGHGNGNPGWIEVQPGTPGYGNGQGTPPWLDAPAVPEPSTNALLLLGVVLFLGWFYKNKNKMKAANVPVKGTDLHFTKPIRK